MMVTTFAYDVIARFISLPRAMAARDDATGIVVAKRPPNIMYQLRMAFLTSTPRTKPL